MGQETRQSWNGQRVLVTGATGFIGQHLTRMLIQDGAQVWAGVWPEESPLQTAALPPQATVVPLDLRQTESVSRAVESCHPDVVIHLAAVGVSDGSVDPLTALDVNVGGSIRLLEAAQRQRARRIILAGSCYEYGAREASEGLDPFNIYAASKAAAWAFARAYWRATGLPVVVARLFQVYGPGQPAHTLVPAAVRAARAGEDFPMTPGQQERDFIFVADVVAGLLATAAAPGIDGQSLDLGAGEAHTVREVVERIWQLTAARGRILAGALPYRPAEVMRVVADAERSARLIGWRAVTPLDDGLRQTIGQTSGR